MFVGGVLCNWHNTICALQSWRRERKRKKKFSQTSFIFHKLVKFCHVLSTFKTSQLQKPFFLFLLGGGDTSYFDRFPTRWRSENYWGHKNRRGTGRHFLSIPIKGDASIWTAYLDRYLPIYSRFMMPMLCLDTILGQM